MHLSNRSGVCTKIYSVYIYATAAIDIRDIRIPVQNGRYFKDKNLKCFFFPPRNSFIIIALKYFLSGPVDNVLVLVQEPRQSFKQWWPSSLTHIYLIRPELVDTKKSPFQFASTRNPNDNRFNGNGNDNDNDSDNDTGNCNDKDNIYKYAHKQRHPEQTIPSDLSIIDAWHHTNHWMTIIQSDE